MMKYFEQKLVAGLEVIAENSRFIYSDTAKICIDEINTNGASYLAISAAQICIDKAIELLGTDIDTALLNEALSASYEVEHLLKPLKDIDLYTEAENLKEDCIEMANDGGIVGAEINIVIKSDSGCKVHRFYDTGVVVNALANLAEDVIADETM